MYTTNRSISSKKRKKQGEIIMIVMNLELDNLFSFMEFKINFSYPKKIVHSTIDSEYLLTKTNFRYKKLNILMGANASGKTSIGKALMSIFNFISKKEVSRIEGYTLHKGKPSCFSIDFLVDEDYLYRVEGCILFEKKVDVKVSKAKIAKNDSYEDVVKKLKELVDTDENVVEEKDDYIRKLNMIPSFGWLFTFPDSGAKSLLGDENDSTLEVNILKSVLMTLDPHITDVRKSSEVKNGFIIDHLSDEIFIDKGEIARKNVLSSGTLAGIDIAYVLSAICKNNYGFFYCDEKFSYIQSDVERAILSLLTYHLKPMSQLFFTTHNLDILDMNFPRHSFTFLKKCEKIEVVDPSKQIQKNDTSLKNAVKNDIFEISPDISKIWELEGGIENG